MTPAQVAHIMALVDKLVSTARLGYKGGFEDMHKARAAVEAALLAPQQAEPTCYKHDEPRKGCTWCDKQSPSAPTAIEPDERAEFEAWAQERDSTHGAKIASDALGLDYPLGRLLWEAWQARASKGTK